MIDLMNQVTCLPWTLPMEWIAETFFFNADTERMISHGSSLEAEVCQALGQDYVGGEL